MPNTDGSPTCEEKTTAIKTLWFNEVKTQDPVSVLRYFLLFDQSVSKKKIRREEYVKLLIDNDQPTFIPLLDNLLEMEMRALANQNGNMRTAGDVLAFYLSFYPNRCIDVFSVIKNACNNQLAGIKIVLEKCLQYFNQSEGGSFIRHHLFNSRLQELMLMFELASYLPAVTFNLYRLPFLQKEITVQHKKFFERRKVPDLFDEKKVIMLIDILRFLPTIGEKTAAINNLFKILAIAKNPKGELDAIRDLVDEKLQITKSPKMMGATL